MIVLRSLFVVTADFLLKQTKTFPSGAMWMATLAAPHATAGVLIGFARVRLAVAGNRPISTPERRANRKQPACRWQRVVVLRSEPSFSFRQAHILRKNGMLNRLSCDFFRMIVPLLLTSPIFSAYLSLTSKMLLVSSRRLSPCSPREASPSTRSR